MSDSRSASVNDEGELTPLNESTRCCDVLVTGAGLPALLAAFECAEVGLNVAVIDALGEDPQNTESFGLSDDEWVSDPEGKIAKVIERIAEDLLSTESSHNSATAVRDSDQRELADNAGTASHTHVQRRVTATPVLWSAKSGWFRQSEPNVLGMPAVAIATENVQALGWRGALRGYADRLKPLLTVGKTRTVAELVGQRFGNAILSQLVEPHIAWKFGRSSNDVDVAIAAPGLNETMSRTGALSSAVLSYAERNVERETSVRPTVGWHQLAQTFRRKLQMYGVTFLPQDIKKCHFENEKWHIQLTDESPLTCRAMVVDCERQFTEQNGCFTFINELLPSQIRTHAYFDIQQLPGLDEARSGLRMTQSGTLKISPDIGGQRRVHVISAVVPNTDHTPLDIKAVIAEVGAVVSEPVSFVTSRTAAPFATLEEKHRAESTMNERVAQQPSVVPVGSNIVGADLGRALQHSQRLSITLRRDLLGL